MSWDNVLPVTWQRVDGVARIGDVSLDALADEVGTPCYVVDETHLVERLQRFRSAFGPDVDLVYAAKAFWCVAMADVLAGAGWMADVVSEGELAVALAGGLAPERVVMHGNVKTDRELELAVAAGVGRIVVDAPDEMARLVALANGRPVDVLLRLNVDVGADTHPKIRTTGAAAQFGMTTEQADETLASVGAGISVRGVHVHIGSQLMEPRLHAEALGVIGRFVEERRDRIGGDTVDLDIGGGFPVAYLHTDVVQPIEVFAQAILGALEDFPDARLLIEPGRSVVATAGVSLYSVISRKPANPPFLAVDGGLSDNPRPSMYGAGYEMVPLVDSASGKEPFRVVGRHCETGDQLGEALLPSTIAAGDRIVMPVTGAYAFSMASRYNLLPRRPVVFVAGGHFRVVVPGESIGDLVR